jgi:hypothetical protein
MRIKQPKLVKDDEKNGFQMHMPHELPGKADSSNVTTIIMAVRIS